MPDSSNLHSGLGAMMADVKNNPSGLLLIAVLICIASMALYANLHGGGGGGTMMAALQSRISAALSAVRGSDGDGVVRKKGAPPIPPPDEIVSLRIYPVKSCRGIELDATRMRKSGLTLDRNWMFIDAATRKFLTIRSDPSMTLIDTRLIDPGDSEGEGKGEGEQTMLEISVHNTDGRVLIPAFPSRAWLEAHTTLGGVEIWEAETDGWVYGEAVNGIFSDFFGKPVALVYKGPRARMVAINGREELYGRAVPHHFADVMSLLVASEASMKDLNRRLAGGGGGGATDADGRLTIERFRPNIVIRGRDDHPWEEDTWKRIRISTQVPGEEEKREKLDLDVVARCARCQVPNVHPDTAAKHPKQPWDMLMKFRRVDDGGAAKWKPCFGMMCIPKAEGPVRVGSRVEVLETTDKHWYSMRAFKNL